MSDLPTREEALALLHEHTATDGLRKHAYAVEAAMRHMARKYGEDEDRWGLVGLMHDFDYERWPDPEDHPRKGSEILAERGYPEDVRYAILTHACYLGLERRSMMDKALFAVDELSGFVMACAMVQPTRSLHSVKVKSVKKKMKAKGFARGVNRDDIRQGAESLELELTVLIEETLFALRGVADVLGLEGSAEDDA